MKKQLAIESVRNLLSGSVTENNIKKIKIPKSRTPPVVKIVENDIKQIENAIPPNLVVNDVIASLQQVKIANVESAIPDKKPLNDEMKLSPEQQVAFEKFKRGENLFVTGPGGTGKTLLIQHFVKHAEMSGKKYQVTSRYTDKPLGPL